MANRNQLANVVTGAIGLGVLIYGANAAKSQHDFAEELRGRKPGIIAQTLDLIGDQKEIVNEGLTPDRVVDATGVEHALLHVGASELFMAVGGAVLVASAISLKK